MVVEPKQQHHQQQTSGSAAQEGATYPVSNWHDPIKLRGQERERVLLKGLKCNINAFVILVLI